MNRIPDKSAELHALYGEFFRSPVPVRAEHTENGNRPDEVVLAQVLKEDKIRRLFEGDTSDYNGDHSKADHAFVYKVYPYTQDEEQIRRLHERSKLSRDKSRDRAGYLQYSLDKVADEVDWFYDWPEQWQPGKRIISSDDAAPVETPPSDADGAKPENRFLASRTRLGQIIREGVPKPRYLYPGVLAEGFVHLVYGAHGLGKTFLALCIAKHIMDEAGRVVYLDRENGANLAASRLQDIGADPTTLDELFYYFPYPQMSGTEEDRAAFVEAMTELKPDLIVIDSLVAFLSAAGKSENSNDEVEQYMYWYLTPLREAGITVLVLDHVTRDASRFRGAGRKGDFADVVYGLKRPEEFGPNLVGEIALGKDKDRPAVADRDVVFSIGGSPEGFVFRRTNGMATPDGRVMPATEGVRKSATALQRFGSAGATSKEWEIAADKEGAKRSQHFEHRKRLVKNGFVDKPGDKYVWIGPTDENPLKQRESGQSGTPTGLEGVSPVENGDKPDRTETGLADSSDAQTPLKQRGSGQSGTPTGLEPDQPDSPVVRVFRTPIGTETGLAEQGVNEQDKPVPPPGFSESAQENYDVWFEGKKPPVTFRRFVEIATEGYHASNGRYGGDAGVAFIRAVCGRKKASFTSDELQRYLVGGHK
jgi:KaiC/GvpD/RAD55 family RecA-like ATPase